MRHSLRQGLRAAECWRRKGREDVGNRVGVSVTAAVCITLAHVLRSVTGDILVDDSVLNPKKLPLLPHAVLPGRPVSNTAANLVALRMRSGKLVRLPLASASLTTSMFNIGGTRLPGIRLLLGPAWEALRATVGGIDGGGGNAGSPSSFDSAVDRDLVVSDGERGDGEYLRSAARGGCESGDKVAIEPVDDSLGDIPEPDDIVILGGGYVLVADPALAAVMAPARLLDRSGLFISVTVGLCRFPMLAWRTSDDPTSCSPDWIGSAVSG